MYLHTQKCQKGPQAGGSASKKAVFIFRKVVSTSNAIPRSNFLEAIKRPTSQLHLQKTGDHLKKEKMLPLLQVDPQRKNLH